MTADRTDRTDRTDRAEPAGRAGPTPPRPDTRYVSDVAALKAIAHPLRVRLLGALRMDGPATASELARRFNESSGATSYHLRQLARFGYVEDDPEQPNARDRRWRAAHQYTSWSDADLAGDPEGAEAARWMRERQRAFAARVATAFDDARDSWSAEWQRAAGQNDLAARLTPASLTELTERVQALAEEYAARDAGAPEAEQVVIYLAGFPVRGYVE
jgi:DNA-binding transcriptional ArsR family regulator